MRFLITGFMPFGSSTLNPSWEAVRRLPPRIGAQEILTAELPVVYGSDLLEELIARTQPDVVLCVGQAAGREGISLEYTAVNVRAASAPDNAGVTYSGEKIIEGAPESLSTDLPLREMAAAMKEADISAKISYSAGTYVCNDRFYRLLYFIASEAPRLRGGFIHIPADTSQAAEFAPGTPTMDTAEVIRALRIAVEEIARNAE